MNICDSASNPQEFWLCGRLWNANNKLETVSHRDQITSIESSFGELLETGDILFFLLQIDRVFKFRDVESTFLLAMSQTLEVLLKLSRKLVEQFLVEYIFNIQSVIHPQLLKYVDNGA